MTKRQRQQLEEALAIVRAIANVDKEDGRGDGAMAYAHALGRANGMAVNAEVILESVLGAK